MDKNKFSRKIISSIFKIKNIINSFFSKKRLDYFKKDIWIWTDNLLEYETRAASCRQEPKTVGWIEKFVSGKTVFYDIGANIGAYSLIAAVNGADVFAFEPSYPNFYKLNKNVSLNNLDKKIACFPVAFSTKTKISKFRYLETIPGTSKSYYNEEYRYRLNDHKLETEKSTIIYSLDDFINVFKIPNPTIVKIDVDGGEFDVIMGGLNTIKNEKLKTILIEIDEKLNEPNEILKFMQDAGFKLESKNKQLLEGVYNYILIR